MKTVYIFLSLWIITCTTTIAQVTVTGSNGANATYATLTDASAVTGAFAAINSAGSQAGNNILITISADIVETGSASLIVSNWTTLTINPTGGVPRLISGNVNGTLINLNGSDNVTIDGLNSGGNALTISNTSGLAGAITLRFASDASNNTVTRCTLLGSSGILTASSGFATVYFANGTSTGNDNNTITQCNISSSATGTPRNAIQSLSGGAASSNNTISSNNIFDFFHPGAASAGISLSTSNSDWTITNNRFYQTATRTATTANTHTGILISSGEGYTITNNIIGFANSGGTGTTNLIGITSGSLGGTFPSSFTAGGTANATRYVGIQCAFTTGGAASSIQNNTIAGIALYTTGVAATTTGLICGIAVTSGNANIGTVTGNTIGVSSGTGSIYAATTTVAGVISGIYCTSSNTINIQNNIMGGIDASGTTATEATGFKGIEVAGTVGTYTISNNTIGNTTANNIRTGYLLTGANLSNTATTPTAASGAANVRAIVSAAIATNLTISNNIMQGFQSSGTASLYRAISNSGSVTGTINITNNQIGTASAGAVNFIAATAAGIHGIYNTAAATTATINITGNSIQGLSLVSSSGLNGIDIAPFTDSDVAINISNNQFGTTTGNFVTYSGIQTGTIKAIYNQGGEANCVLTIQNNSIRGIVHSVAASCPHTYIQNDAPGLASVNILGNAFVNLSVNTTGNITFIDDAGGMGATGTSSCSNNAIVTAFNKTAAGGSVYFYVSGGNNVNGSTMTETGNNFSNVTVTGSTNIIGWQNFAGLSGTNGPGLTITGNTFSNITGGSGSIYIMYIISSGTADCSSNTISNITGTGHIYGIEYNSNAAAIHTCSFNTISSLSSTGGGGNVAGITGSTASTTAWNINNNAITGLSSTGAGILVIGVRILGGNNVYVSDNQVNNLSGAGGSATAIVGIGVYGGTTVNLYKNNIHSLSLAAVNTGISTTVVNGIYFAAGTTCTAYNNFISNLTTPNANAAFAIAAIEISSVAASTTYNLYYNSIYMNAASTGTNFGTYGVYAYSSATATSGALNMINNIIVNTSTPNGTGVAAAYGRTNTTLTNYAAASDHNLFYAGTPSLTNLIFYDGTNSDQTLSAYQTRVSTRDANSISLMPAFTSATDLHLTPVNCRIDGRGTPIGSVTTDIDAAARNATTPDIGADEFNATTSTTLAGVAGAPVCEDRTVSVSGTTYKSNPCDLIAMVKPSGADPVGGKVNVCVTLDATQQYFNGEPYVQRHFDMEPTTSNQATTSATITLYFTDAEFVLYNTTNPVVWPRLPTAVLGNADPNRANVKVTQFHGAATTSPSSPGNYPGVRVLIDPVDADVFWNGSYWAATFDVSGFSGFYVHTNNYNSPLPVIVNYLTGRKQGSNHLLNWKVTCTSTPRATMTLERSSDARNYSGMYTITADAARCQQPFDHTDTNPLKGMNYYRLKIVDVDGKVTYSTTVALLNAVKGFDMVSIAPNPVVSNHFKLNVASAQAGKMEVVIFDMQGRLVNRQTLTLIAGYNSMPVNVANLAPGTYTIKGSMADDQSKVLRFVKQ